MKPRYQHHPHSRPTLHPVVTLQVPLDSKSQSAASSSTAQETTASRRSVSSVCFLPTGGCTHGSWSLSTAAVDGGGDSDVDVDTNDCVSSSSSGGDEQVQTFQCLDLVQDERSHDADIQAGARHVAASLSLSGTRLVSCHMNGDSFVWDLGRRRIVREFCKPRGGRGMALRRLGDAGSRSSNGGGNGSAAASSTNLLYQTRDARGTVTIHDSETNQVVTLFETHSFSYCAAAPCTGNPNVLVLPTAHESVAEVRDVRVSPTLPPVVRFHGNSAASASAAGGILPDGTTTENDGKHGMLTSVAMSESALSMGDDGSESVIGAAGRPVVACGMESGTVFFHDLRFLAVPINDGSIAPRASRVGSTNVKLGDDPVLGIDLSASPVTTPKEQAKARSFVSVAGMAGDAAKLSELPVEDRGRVAVIKASFGCSTDQDAQTRASARLRARVSTCQVSGPDEANLGGKPGVASCRFRPDGRVFAVGGWDRRVRIFDRTGNAAPLAILKGHEGSVTALDWAPDSPTTGFLATGADDGRIHIWRCFPSRAG